METYFDLGFGAYLTNLSVGILFLLLIVKLLDIFFKKTFSPGWRYVIAVAMTVFFLIPVRAYGPWSIIPVLSFNTPLHIKSPEPVLLDGITEINHYSTNADPQWDFLYEYLFYIWLAGAVITLLYQVIRLALFYRTVRKKGIPCGNSGYREQLSEICGEIKVKTPGLVVFPETDTPFAMGIISPKIILPQGEFSGNELEYIFRHEVCHIKRADIFMKLFLIIFRCVNWFNPLAYILVKNVFADMEIACDERACRGFSDDRREEYSRTLLRSASRVKCPAVTTYLSPNARVVKNRIDAVMNVRKFGRVVPFTAAFALIFTLSQVCYAMPDEKAYAWYVFTDPYPMEADPYITSDKWRTAGGDDPAEAGEKIFRQYMEMYMGEDVPEYYRIEDYYIKKVSCYDNSKYIMSYFFPGYGVEIDPIELSTKGILTEHEYVTMTYSFVTANKCGNTVHNKNFGDDLHLNGVSNNSIMTLELEKDGDNYRAVNMGSSLIYGYTSYHFDNEFTHFGSLDHALAMAQAGLLDYSWDDMDALPSPDDLCEYAYRNGQLFHEILDIPTDDDLYLEASFGNSMDIDPVHAAKAEGIVRDADGYAHFAPEKLKIDRSKGFEYCGFETDLEDLSAVIYGNVTGDDPHGVKLYLYISDDELDKHYSERRLHKVEVTDELFTPVIYHDTFDNIPLPKDMTDPAEILEYMKTPHDGCDFTVLDYNSITEETDGTYANVCFKGRLDGQYSSDLKQDKNNDGYIRVRITGKSDPQQKGVSL